MTETLIRVVADQVISDMVDSVHLWHEGPVMRVQCQLVIWIGHIRLPKGTFHNFFMIDGSTVKLTSNFTLSSFEVQFESVINVL